MEEGYSFNRFWKDLDDGLEIYYTYSGKRYLIYKITKNCYKQLLISTPEEKSPHPKMSTVTLKRVKEMFPYMENMEYKTGL